MLKVATALTSHGCVRDMPQPCGSDHIVRLGDTRPDRCRAHGDLADAHARGYRAVPA